MKKKRIKRQFIPTKTDEQHKKFAYIFFLQLAGCILKNEAAINLTYRRETVKKVKWANMFFFSFERNIFHWFRYRIYMQ